MLSLPGHEVRAQTLGDLDAVRADFGVEGEGVFLGQFGGHGRGLVGHVHLDLLAALPCDSHARLV